MNNATVYYDVLRNGLHCRNVFSTLAEAEKERARLNRQYPDAVRTVVPLFEQPTLQPQKETS